VRPQASWAPVPYARRGDLRAASTPFGALFAGLLIALSALPIGAQERTDGDDTAALRPALVIGGPSSIGVQLPLTPRILLRPDLSVTRTTFNVGATESKFVVVTLGMSALVWLREREALRTYAAPRVALARSTYDNGSFTDQWFFETAFGVSAPLTRRLAIFGEVGPRVTYTDQSSVVLVNRTTNVVIRSGLGATVSF
jgi:hypothetical protein